MSDLTKETIEQGKAYVKSLFEKTKTKEQAAMSSVTSFAQILKEYSSASRDLVSSRLRYLDFIDKYEGGKEPVMPASSFPGIVSQPKAQTELVSDSAEMKDLANVIRQLNTQVDTLEYHLKDTLKLLLVSTNGITAGNQALAKYLDQLVEGIDSAYDVGLFGVE